MAHPTDRYATRDGRVEDDETMPAAILAYAIGLSARASRNY